MYAAAIREEPPAAVLETARLRLRAPFASDAVYLAELANDLEVARMTTGVPHPYRLADAQAFLARLAARGEESSVFVAEHPDFGPIGLVGVHRGSDGPWPELGYWLGRTFRGRGFATEAVQAVVAWAAEAGWAPALVAGHFEDNPASARVLDKAGFLYTGEVRRRFSHGRGAVVPSRMMVRLA